MSGRRSWGTALLSLTLPLGTAWAPVTQAQEAPKAPATGTAGAAPSTAKPAAAEPAKVSAEPEGFFVQSSSGDYRLQFNAILQADGRFFAKDPARLETDSFLLRSGRPILQATVGGRFDLALVPDFGQGQSLIQDAYIDARVSPKARLRVGKLKTPFGLERLQAESSLQLVERALPTDIVPNRDVGVQISGDLRGGVVSYAVALLNGVLDGASQDLATADAKDGVARVFLRPFRRGDGPLRGLGFGMATTLGRQQGPLPSYRTPGQVVFFSYVKDATADGRRIRLSPQASFYGGPLGLLAEYVRSTQAVRRDPVRANVTNDAWQVTASWLLTGEKATPGTLKPRRSFDPGKGGWGALELAARVHQLRVGDNAFSSGFADLTKSARKATAWGLDLHWYLNRNVKYVVNFEQTRFDGGAAAGDRETENVAFFRAQLAF